VSAEPRRLVLRLPLPPNELNPNNSRGGFVQLPRGKRLYPRAQAAKDYRGECVMWLDYCSTDELCDWDAVPFYFARISLSFRWCKGRRAWDADNAMAAAKPLVDSLRDKQILRDDAAKRVTYGSVESKHCKRGCRCGGAVVVTVEEVGG